MLLPSQAEVALRPDILRREILRCPGVEARLTYYPPGSVMAAHAHDTDQFSMLLLGGLQEDASGAGGVELCGFAAGFKGAGQKHANAYGPHGALMLAIDRAPAGRDGEGWRWRRAPGEASLLHLARMLIDRDTRASEAADLADEIVAAIPGAQAQGPASPAAPAWLGRIREEIEDAPQSASLSALAHGAGVHPVHLSRRFSAAFGMPLSVYRRRVMAMRAVCGIIQHGLAAADAACDAGFADQAHLTRVLRAEVGLTPRKLSRLFAGRPC